MHIVQIMICQSCTMRVCHTALAMKSNRRQLRSHQSASAHHHFTSSGNSNWKAGSGSGEEAATTLLLYQFWRRSLTTHL
jgi:hypothetical protein